MRPSVHLKRQVAEMYHQITGKIPKSWIKKTHRYVSVKLLDRHLSHAEHIRFITMLSETYGDQFIVAKNAIAQTRRESGSVIQEPKVIVRFRLDQL